MSDVARFGEGPLSQAAAMIYTLVVVELLVLLSAAPSLLLLWFLERDASNLPLAALLALPIGPALSAALYSLHHRSSDLTDLKPWTAFWRGYRLNFKGALKVWVPWLAWLTIVAINLANFRAAGVPGWWAVLLVIIGTVATLWEANALVITSLFEFRARDVARLAGYFLARAATLGNAALLVVAAAVTVFSSEVVLALLASVFALAVLRNSRHMIDEIRREFIA